MQTPQTKSGGVNREHGAAFVQKLTFSLGHVLVVLVGAWLVLGSGWYRLGNLFDQQWTLADPRRAQILLAVAAFYWLRHALTLFYMIQRKVDWSEALGLTGFIAFFELGLILVGGGAFRDEAAALNRLDIVALILLLLGSWLNTYSELQRKWWKQNPENQGHCYTKGLFSLSMHINYFGDVVLFTGWCLLSGNLWTLLLPLMMAWMFISIHIPGLDQHLATRYGTEYTAYSRTTKKLIPWIY